MKRKKILAAAILLLVAVAVVFWYATAKPVVTSDAAPTSIRVDPDVETEPATLDDVFRLATEARNEIIRDVDDYTAVFTKQERDAAGVLGESSSTLLKIQTRHRDGEWGTPMRVYMKWLSPDRLAGREVIWGEDIFGGMLRVRETGFLSMVPIPPLDPNGMLAMQGQKYPISDIGQTRLIEKLIERGEADRGNPDVSVVIQENVPIDDKSMTLIQVKRDKPGGGEDDFSLAEIVIDNELKWIVRYQSFGWPENGQTEPPLLESIRFDDVELNVGLTDEDFDPKNPEYGYP